MCSVLTALPFLARLRTRAGLHIADYCLQSSAVTLDTLQVATSSVIGTHTEEQQETTVTSLDKLAEQSQIQSSGKQKTSRRQVGLANSCLQPPLHEGSYFYHSDFLLSVLHSWPRCFAWKYIWILLSFEESFFSCQSLFSIAGYPVCNRILNSRTNSFIFPNTG